MNKKYISLIIVLLVIACLVTYGRILGNDFVNYDDDRLITENNHIQTGFNTESVKWALTNASLEYWHPLTWLSIMLEWRLFGMNASFYHLVSLLLHIGAALFLFLFLNKATKRLWPSAFVAALFALHPLRVESVAWAAEHKDVLSMFFGMATLYAYSCYVEKPLISKYFVCLVLFALSLMSKPTLSTLPCVLLLLDYWPLARWQKPFTSVNVPAVVDHKNSNKKSTQHKATSHLEKEITTPIKSPSQMITALLWEKVPFFLLSILFSIMLIGQLRTDNYMLSLEQNLFSHRIMNATLSYVSYLYKTFWPVNLAVFYAYEHSFQLWQVISAAFVLLAISVAVVYLAKKAPFLAIGWLWYLGTLFPVSGLLQIGDQAMADRYTYLPSIGIAIMLAWGVLALIKSEGIRKKIILPAGMIFLFVMAFISWNQCGYWKNSIELFSHALKVTSNNWVAYNNRGQAYIKLGNYNQVIEDCGKAIEINPAYAYAYNNRGLAYTKLRQYQRAIEDFNQATRLKPYYAAAYGNRGIAYGMLGNNEQGCRNAREACELGSCGLLEAANIRGLCR